MELKYTDPEYYLLELDKPEELAKWNAMFGPGSKQIFSDEEIEEEKRAQDAKATRELREVK